jgi:hypothetical protein
MRSLTVIILSVFGILSASSQGTVYLVLGSDTGIWDGMDVNKYNCTYALGLFTDPARNAARVMDPAFRSQLLDSYGTPVKLTWWLMAGNMYRGGTNTNVPHPSTMNLYLMKKHHATAIAQWGDELTLHFHTFHWSDYDGDGRWYWNQAHSFTESESDFNTALGEMLLDEETFPVSFRSGWHAMDNFWQARLDSVLPYSLHNDWPAVRKDSTEPIDNVYDWSRAPSTFVPFHPSPTDYQVPGAGRGWNVRSKYMASVDSSFMSKIFAEANKGIDQVACFWAHLPEADFPDNIQKVNASVHKAALRYPNIRFRYCTAVEAMQAWRRTADKARPVVTMNEIDNTNDVRWIVRTNEPIFQYEPFIAVKDRYENYTVIPCTRVAALTWQTTIPVNRLTLAKAGVAVTDTAGNYRTLIRRYLPDDIYVDDGESGYKDVYGVWGSSSASAWGTTSRSVVLGAADSARAQWTFSVPIAGQYGIFVQVPQHTSPAQSVRYTLFDGTAAVDSAIFTSGVVPNRWVSLTTRRLSDSVLHTVQISARGASQVGATLAADVVKISALVRERWLVVPDLLDGGEIIVDEPATLPLNVRNAGYESLRIAGMSSASGAVSLPQTLPLIIPPMSDAPVYLQVTAHGSGIWTDTLIIASDDPVNPITRIFLRAAVREYFVVVDDRDSTSYHERGSWSFSNAQAYGGTSRFAYPASGVAAVFSARPHKTGLYEIAAIVPTTTNASTRARYRLSVSGADIDSVFLDQNSGSGSWVALLNRQLQADTLVTVTLTDAMSPVVSGKVLRTDAIRFQWIRNDPTSVEREESSSPICFGLEQNYPNPFNGISNIGFSLPAQQVVYDPIGSKTRRESSTGQAGILEFSHVTLKVFDLLGREVATLVNEMRKPGSYMAQFNATGLATGVYLLRLTAGTFVQSRRMILIR